MPRVILNPPAWEGDRSLGFDGRAGRVGDRPMYRLRVFLARRLVGADNSVDLAVFREQARLAMFREYRQFKLTPKARFCYGAFFAQTDLVIEDPQSLDDFSG